MKCLEKVNIFGFVQRYHISSLYHQGWTYGQSQSLGREGQEGGLGSSGALQALHWHSPHLIHCLQASLRMKLHICFNQTEMLFNARQN
jgi:hypothetical protein